MCRGRMPSAATRSRKGASMAENWKITVVSSGVSTRAILFQPTRPRTSTSGLSSTVVGEGHVAGGERRAVVPLHARAQLEGIAQPVLRDAAIVERGHLDGERRRVLELVVDLDQRGVDELADLGRHREPGDRPPDPIGLLRRAVHDLAAGLGLLRARAGSDGGEGEDREGDGEATRLHPWASVGNGCAYRNAPPARRPGVCPDELGGWRSGVGVHCRMFSGGPSSRCAEELGRRTGARGAVPLPRRGLEES